MFIVAVVVGAEVVYICVVVVERGGGRLVAP